MSSLSWGKIDLLGIYLEAKVLRIRSGLSNSYSHSHDTVLQQTGIQVPCHAVLVKLCVHISFWFFSRPTLVTHIPWLGHEKGRAA